MMEKAGGGRGSEAPMDIERPIPRWNSQESDSPHHHKISVPMYPIPKLHSSPNHKQDPKQAKRVKKSIWRHFANPNLPHLLIGYVQLLFNMSLACILLYIILSFMNTVRLDLNSKTTLHTVKLLSEVDACRRAYIENKCDPTTRVPAMDGKCREWEACMAKERDHVARAKIVAETMADIVNGLLEPITVKSLAFIIVALLGSVFLSNYAFALAKSRIGPSEHTVRIRTDPGADEVKRPKRRMIKYNNTDDE